jgi:creatinine amidohydrolase/Fe(II)-dependent formamide hydrolase-like protein
MQLADMNTFDQRLQQKNVYLVSLGALEQHGRYAPLGTDDFAQDALLAKVQADGKIDHHDAWTASPEIGAKLLDIYSQNLVAKITDLMV